MLTRNLQTKLIAATLVLSLSSFAFVAQAVTCSTLTESQALNDAEFAARMNEPFFQTSKSHIAYTQLQIFKQQRLNQFNQAFPEVKLAPIRSLLGDPHWSFAHDDLASAISIAQGNPNTPTAFIEAIKVKLKERNFTDAEIQARIAQWDQTPNKETLLQILGKRNIDEIRTMVYGTNPLEPSAESVLGRFIAETGAQTGRFSFGTQPGLSGPRGNERLYVKLDPNTFPIYLNYFKTRDYFMHIHTPGQGTLMIGFNGEAGSYAQMTGGAIRAPQDGTIMPHIILSTTESQKLENVFNSSRLGLNTYAQQPWQMPGYCATGGYASCTHWFGNLPIGDNLVDTYRFPGYVDSYASNHVSTGDDAAPRIQALADYTQTPVYLGLSPVQKVAYSLVWKTPGYEQMSDVLGLQTANLAGELANPGYVALKLIGEAPIDRVPVVFVYTANAHEPFPAGWTPNNISAH
jgi:hypothetical protein